MSRMISAVIVVFNLFFVATANSATPTITELAKLVANDRASADYFGYSLAFDGDTAVVGAYGDDDLGSQSGSAYVFVRDGAGVWHLQQKLTASDGAADDRFGWDVALDGDTAVIGRESWDWAESLMGAAYVFTRDSAGVWSERQKITAFDGAPGDQFGESVAVSENTILVGAKADDDLGTYAGSVYIFASDSAGFWTLQQKLTASNGGYADWFGNTLHLDGDTAVIGAMGYDYNGTLPYAGIAYIFTRDSTGAWTERQMLQPHDPADNSYGKSVAVSGDTAVVGADLDDQVDVNTGAAYVFTRDSAGVWSEGQKLTARDATNSDYFGHAVDIDGSNLVVGAYGDDDNGDNAGSAYIFSRDAAGVWYEQAKLLASDGSASDYLGGGSRSVGISATTVLTGAPLDDSSSGAAYLFNIVPSTNAPDIAVSTSAVNFGDLLVGQTVQKIVTLSNYGMADLSISGISIASGGNFSQTNDCPAILLPSVACQITVSFAPTVEGALSDTLTILSNDPDEAMVSVALSGNGITKLPDLVVSSISSPNPLIVGEYVDIGFTITNQGAADVSGGYYVYLYLDATFLGMDWVSYAPAAGATKGVSWFVPVPRLSKGTHTLKAIVDTNNDILESSETNNTLTKAVSVQPF